MLPLLQLVRLYLCPDSFLLLSLPACHANLDMLTARISNLRQVPLLRKGTQRIQELEVSPFLHMLFVSCVASVEVHSASVDEALTF